MDSIAFLIACVCFTISILIINLSLIRIDNRLDDSKREIKELKRNKEGEKENADSD